MQRSLCKKFQRGIYAIICGETEQYYHAKCLQMTTMTEEKLQLGM